MPSKSSLPWLFAAIWLCAPAVLCIALMYTGPIQEGLEGAMLRISLSRRIEPTPTLNWPAPSPTSTPKPTPIPAPTSTPKLETLIGEIDTIAALVAYEALGEPQRGQKAVAYVLLHRARAEGKLPSEILTRRFFGAKGGARRIAKMKEWWTPDNDDIPLEGWQQATEIAEGVANGWSYDEFPTSTHFYSRCVLREPPDWAEDFKFLECIGCHCFYSALE